MSEMDSVWARLEARYAHLIGNFVANFAIPIETYGELPPVLFGSRLALLNWAQERGLGVFTIPGSRETSALLVRAANDHELYGYEQIWVRVGYGAYKKPMRAIATIGFDMTGDDLRNIDADHVVNRARLRRFPFAWVCLFPVVDRANRPFGNVERTFDPILALDRMDLHPLMALKLFSNKMPRTVSELRRAMQDIAGKFLETEEAQLFRDEIWAHALPHMRPDNTADLIENASPDDWTYFTGVIR